jgi:GNAT superfamily N-acetyltransferase
VSNAVVTLPAVGEPWTLWAAEPLDAVVLPRPPFTVRTLCPCDIEYLVSSHLAHFPEGFFARLGRRFLIAYYESFLNAADVCAVVAEDVDGRRMGVLVGVTHPERHRSELIKRYRTRLVLHAARSLSARPGLALHFVRTRLVRYAVGLSTVPRRQPGRVTDQLRHAVLHHLVVEPAAQGQGVGSQLLARLDSAAAAAGCRRIILVTRSEGQGATFYRATGWLSCGEHCTPEGVRLETFARAVSNVGHHPQDDQGASS